MNVQKAYHSISFQALREAHPEFFLGWAEVQKSSSSQIVVTHRIPGLMNGHSSIHFDFPEEFSLQTSLDPIHLALVDAVSYWKSTCSPTIHLVESGFNPTWSAFWKKLFYFGLGEFRFQNQIDSDQEPFVCLKGPPSQSIPSIKVNTDERKILVPVSGGKDSAVTLELIKQFDCDPILFLLNPLPAAFRAISNAKLDHLPKIIAHRSIDPELLRLNSEGYLNGHTPFSALLAFLTSYAAAKVGAGKILLSNEGSANEGNTSDNSINHQYSKSYEFESDFREYLNETLSLPISYFSLLRPLNEIQIVALLCQHPQHLESFLSCNRGGKDDRWCCECPKCLFVALCLACFVTPEELITIFGGDPFQHTETQYQTLCELALEERIKPFECVGSRREVLGAIQHIKLHTSNPLIDRFAVENPGALSEAADLETILHDWNGDHVLPQEYESVLRKSLSKVVS